MGRKVIELLEIETSATHMEWFFGPKGLKFSEIGCRPPGVRAWDLYSAGNDMDLYREWALAGSLLGGNEIVILLGGGALGIARALGPDAWRR